MIVLKILVTFELVPHAPKPWPSETFPTNLQGNYYWHKTDFGRTKRPYSLSISQLNWFEWDFHSSKKSNSIWTLMQFQLDVWSTKTFWTSFQFIITYITHNVRKLSWYNLKKMVDFRNRLKWEIKKSFIMNNFWLVI